MSLEAGPWGGWCRGIKFYDENMQRIITSLKVRSNCELCGCSDLSVSYRIGMCA
jgi:hypothetical protein